MSASAIPDESPQRTRVTPGLFLMTTFVVFAYGILLTDPDSTSVRTLSLTFASIMLEAVPFMLFGALVGGLIEAFVSRERMTSLLPKKGAHTILLAAGMGILFPVCECAVVPVVRRLARKGLPASAAIAYLLGGPIVNPIVAASTALAYKFDWRVVIVRTVLGYLVAVVVALLMDKIFRTSPVLREDLDDHETHAHSHTHDKPHAQHTHDHTHAHAGHNAHTHDACGCSCGCGHDHAPATAGGKFAAAFRHAAHDFIGVGHFLVIGAFIAALAQTFVNRQAFLDIAALPLLPGLMMILLAILLNLCSEADAFIAASFRGLMPLWAQMAFLLTGPMFDLKLLLMYQGVFRRRAILALSGLILFVIMLVSGVLSLCTGVFA